jgi:hypothetical protein
LSKEEGVMVEEGGSSGSAESGFEGLQIFVNL